VRRQAGILGLAAGILLVSAWVFDGDRGVAVIAAGMGFGWMVRFLTPSSGADAAPVAPVAPASDASDVGERLQALEAKTSSLRHDLRGILSPALLIAERLLAHEDPAIRRAGDVMMKTVERATDRLAETKRQTPQTSP
jgi:hypothetical protein